PMCGPWSSLVSQRMLGRFGVSACAPREDNRTAATARVGVSFFMGWVLLGCISTISSRIPPGPSGGKGLVPAFARLSRSTSSQETFTMQVLVLNPGSATLKFRLLDTTAPPGTPPLANGLVEHVEGDRTTAAAEQVLAHCQGQRIEAVGCRVVH